MQLVEINYDKDIFSRNIKVLLAENNMTQDQLAEQTKVGTGTISRYVNKWVKPKKKNIDAIADLFKVNVLWLLLGEGPKYIAGKENETQKPFYSKNNSVLFSVGEQKTPLDQCFELLQKIQRLDDEAFFTVKGYLEGIVTALKFKKGDKS